MTVWLNAKALRSIQRRHPWIFAGAVEKTVGEPEPGDVVQIVDSGGRFLGWGHFSPHSQIRVRILSRQDERIDDEWWRNRLQKSLSRRSDLAAGSGLTAWRMVFAEADLLPGLIVDWYDGYAVMQNLTVGMDRMKHALAEIITDLTGAKGVFERSDSYSRNLEGLKPCLGVLLGETPPDDLEILEYSHRFKVNLQSGQKTGFFLDQRENRFIAAGLAKDKDVLDVFAHTNAFGVYMAKGGASSLTRIESSPEASAVGEFNLTLNGCAAVPGDRLVGDAFRILRDFRDRGRTFDMIVLDPPKLAPTRAHASKAARAYKDINLLAVKLLRPDGLLLTCSCSQGVDENLFQKIVFGAALDAGRDVRMIRRLGPGGDHPVLLSFPESSYLKGFVCRVD
jgi:23S rRNA (cytosine1962-C5)-methyltransferase